MKKSSSFLKAAKKVADRIMNALTEGTYIVEDLAVMAEQKAAGIPAYAYLQLDQASRVAVSRLFRGLYTADSELTFPTISGLGDSTATDKVTALDNADGKTVTVEVTEVSGKFYRAIFGTDKKMLVAGDDWTGPTLDIKGTTVQAEEAKLFDFAFTIA